MVGYAFHYKKSKEGEMKRRPPWLKLLLDSKFFGACEIHKNLRKSEENIYCIDCNQCMCTQCLFPHRHHKFLQIRRYVYQDVVRIDDVDKLLDVSHVQPYTVNNAKVVLLNPRKPSKPSKSNTVGSLCKICHRTVPEPSRYCSIACKTSEESDGRRVVLSGADGGCKQSEPFLENLTSDLENYAATEMESSSSLSSAQPSDSSNTTQGHPIRNRRRKGIPCRSPFF